MASDDFPLFRCKVIAHAEGTCEVICTTTSELWKSMTETTAALTDPGYPAAFWAVLSKVVFENTLA